MMASVCVEYNNAGSVDVCRTSSALQAVSRLDVNVTDDADYVCRWSSLAGSADDLTCSVAVITGVTSYSHYLVNHR